MRKRVKSIIFALTITLPLVFVLIFLGYFPVQYSIIVKTDNIVGEGICQTYICPPTRYMAFYRVSFYFGSELKKATLGNFHYDVDALRLVTADVSEFEITSIDSYWHGIHLTHIDPQDILSEGEELKGSQSLLTSKDGVLHIQVFDPNEGATIVLSPTFIPAWFWIAYFSAMALIAVAAALLFGYLFEKIPALKRPLFKMTCIGVTLLAGCFFCGSLPCVTYVNFLLNWLLLFALSLMLDALTLPFLGTVLTMAFTTFWYVANYFVIHLRGKPIMPSDLKAIGTAREVMGGYTFAPSWQMVAGVAVVALYAAALVALCHRHRRDARPALKRRLAVRAVSMAAAVAMMVVGVNTQTFKSLGSFAWDVSLLKDFHQDGMLLTFLKSALNSRVRMPEGYSREKVAEYLEEYLRQETPADGVRPTNIIMVMNEAFSDLRTVGLNPEIDIMPFIDSLEENTVEGSLYVSVFGGGTCNTEFEALTGNSLAFLGAGAYPYTENVTKPLFSLASYFREQGYKTDAFHCNEPQNWNRNMVYPNLGFDAFHSIVDFEAFGEVPHLHDLPADIADYRYIEAVSDENADRPRFLFDVTMQNHSGYERWLDVEKDATVAKYGSELYLDTQIYLSLVRASDEAVRQLVETYRDSDEPTMIVFFGDHQPGLPYVAIEELYSELSSQLDLYKSKFFIWTNYDSPQLHNAGVSANFLPWLILDQGNFSLPPYVQMLKELYEHYPVISAQGVMSIDGNIYSSVAEVMDDPLIQKYQYIQYANLFDEIDPAWFEVK